MLFITILLSSLINNPSSDTTIGKPLPHIIQTTQTDKINKKLLLDLVNNARTQGCSCGDTYFPPVAPLEWNEQLENAAAGHSKDMAQRGYFSHVSPDGIGAGKRIEQSGYHWRQYGENIGLGYQDENQVISGWLHSPNHCKNIMSGNYKEMAVAREGNYWTQDFGSR